ncbi:hypothetical protein [Mannheimia pernigra]|uniref:hypothetical protein n=1 Tax=Mannheimia pernigra TaxID=111844 RepID=UPI00159F4505|nr:hypothetical protein [Mannheimia pernigra]QLB44686.1 hypothetical protein HV561_07990 [Mannheimia pernigra]
MKSSFIDNFSYLAIALMVIGYNRYILTSDLTFYLQFALLFIISTLAGLVYQKAKKHSAVTPFSLLWTYLIFLCATVLALASFSQTELQQLGFNFTDDENEGIRQYLSLKGLFFLIGAVVFPQLLESKKISKKP